MRLGAAERVGPDGVVEELTEDELARIVDEARRSGAESIRHLPVSPTATPPTSVRSLSGCAASCDVHVSASHEVLAQFREYERCSTTDGTDAEYLSPLLDRYPGAPRGASATCPGPPVVVLIGRRRPATEAARAGAWSVLWVRRARWAPALLTRLSGDPRALGFDMGGMVRRVRDRGGRVGAPIRARSSPAG